MSILSNTPNQTLAFSQYAHKSESEKTPGYECPFFRDGACHKAPAGVDHFDIIKGRPSWMGFSVRNQQWRYTAWMPFNGTRAWWKSGPSSQELYSHDYPLSTVSMDEIGEKENLAYRPEHKQRCKDFYQIVRNFFEHIAPPTEPKYSE